MSAFSFRSRQEVFHSFLFLFQDWQDLGSIFILTLQMNLILQFLKNSWCKPQLLSFFRLVGLFNVYQYLVLSVNAWCLALFFLVWIYFHSIFVNSEQILSDIEIFHESMKFALLFNWKWSSLLIICINNMWFKSFLCYRKTHLIKSSLNTGEKRQKSQKT